MPALDAAGGGGTGAALTPPALLPRAAAEEATVVPQGSLYTDAADKFTIAVPPGWVQGAGDLSGPRNKYSNSEGLRRVVAWCARHRTASRSRLAANTSLLSRASAPSP